ncbi:MAG: glutathione peroxidase [Lentisphaeria bacterium]|nr:glutathione peroxidase [Lentisphaeria bacterium]
MSVYDFQVTDAAGKPVGLNKYQGKVLLIVNTASKCGFTPQYEGLEKLYQTYKDQGLVVLGFPCNQFGNQEPGKNDAIQSFCQVNYGVTFPVMAKIKVNGPEAIPLYTYLKKEASGLAGTEAIKWNFTKFLVDKDGRVRARHGSKTKPSSLAGDIEKLLAED